MQRTLSLPEPQLQQAAQDQIQAAKDAYTFAADAAIERLRRLEDKTTDPSTKARYEELITATTQKRDRHREYILKESSATRFCLDQTLTMQRKMRIEEFVEWLEKRAEEMDGVGREDEEYDAVDAAEAVEDFEEVDHEDAEGDDDGVEATEGKKDWVRVSKK